METHSIRKTVGITEDEDFEAVLYDGTEETRDYIAEALGNHYTVHEVSVTYRSMTADYEPMTVRELQIRPFGSLENPIEISKGEYVITKGIVTVLEKKQIYKGNKISVFDLNDIEKNYGKE